MSSKELSQSRTYIIGRRGDIQLDDPTVSGKHAELSVIEGRFYLTDLKSTNGTYVWRDDLWVRFHEGYVNVDTRLSFGHCARTVADLLDLRPPTTEVPLPKFGTP